MNQIGLFLHQMKSIVSEHGFILVEREQCLQFLADFGMSIAQLTDIILSLEPKDCFDGPEPDRDPRYSEHWTVAEFSPSSQEAVLYLKLSIRVDARRCKCLSVKLYRDKAEMSQ